MFDLNSKYQDVYSDKDIGKYANHLISFSINKETKIYQGNNSPWPEKEAIRSLNVLIELEKEKKIFYKNINESSSFILLRQDKRNPLAIVVAGGGYAEVCTLPEALPVAVALYEKGFSTITFDYGVNENARRAKDELSELFDYLMAHEDELEIVVNNYILIGFSAGAHLCANYALSQKQAKIGTLVLSYPVITMKEPYAHIGTRNNLLGENPSKKLIEEYSIESHITKNYPRTFIWQCEKDNVVPFENSKIMAEALNKKGIPNDFISFPSDVHGFGIAKDTVAESWFERMLSFHNKYV